MVRRGQDQVPSLLLQGAVLSSGASPLLSGRRIQDLGRGPEGRGEVLLSPASVLGWRACRWGPGAEGLRPVPVAPPGVVPAGGDFWAWFPFVDKSEGLLARPPPPVCGIRAGQWEDVATTLPVSRPRGVVTGPWTCVPTGPGPQACAV